MSVNSNVSVTVNNTGDVILDKIYVAAANAVASGSVTLHSLSAGNNTITLPASAGIAVRGAVIVPPVGNLQTIILKGVGADTGVGLSKTNPTFLSFDTTPPATFVLTAGGTIAGLLIVWT